MAGHAERVTAHMRSRAPKRHHGITVRRKDQRPPKADAELTGRQRHKRARATDDLELNQRIMDSGLWDGQPRSRRSWCALLRDLELHPERLDEIKAKMARNRPAPGAPSGPDTLDEVTA